MFHDHPLPAQLLPVQLVHGVVGVPVVLELHESIAERTGTVLNMQRETRQKQKAEVRSHIQVTPLVRPELAWLGAVSRAR